MTDWTHYQFAITLVIIGCLAAWVLTYVTLCLLARKPDSPKFRIERAGKFFTIKLLRRSWLFGGWGYYPIYDAQTDDKYLLNTREEADRLIGTWEKWDHEDQSRATITRSGV